MPVVLCVLVDHQERSEILLLRVKDRFNKLVR